ncbi:MAG: YceD family protein [Thiohalomonadales bacterium]
MPQFIDPFRLADVGRMYAGNMPVKQMKRLLPLLKSSSSNEYLAITLAFDKDTNGVHFLAGSIVGTLTLLCQRCLTEMDFTINVDLLIAFLASEFDEEKLGQEYEPCIVNDTPIMLSDIIEDELLLALPAIPKHNDTQCSEQITHLTHTKSETVLSEDDKDTNPFSVLKDLNK